MELAKRLPELSPDELAAVASSGDIKAVADLHGLMGFLKTLADEKPRLAAVCVAATDSRTTPNCLCAACVDTASSVAFGFSVACVAFDAMQSRPVAPAAAPCACHARELPKVSREDRDTVVKRVSAFASDPRAYSDHVRLNLADLRRAQPELGGLITSMQVAALATDGPAAVKLIAEVATMVYATLELAAKRG